MKKKIFKTDSCSPQLGNWEQQLSNAAILEGTYSPNEVKNLIGKLDFYIIGRLYVRCSSTISIYSYNSF